MTTLKSSAPQVGGTTRLWPNLFMVGAPKSGTTALATYLSQHPDIYVAPKELSYFGSDLDFRTRMGQPWHIGLDGYLAWFSPHAGTRYLGDRSVFYLYSTEAASEIHQAAPEARIIIMLRDPVDQMHSQHSEMLYQGDEDITDFAHALDAEEDRKVGRRLPVACQKAFGLLYRDLARYADQVERYFEAFGTDRVCVVLYDDLVVDAAAVHRRVLDFLGVDVYDEPVFSVVNANKQARSNLAMRLLHRPPPQLRRLGRAIVRDGQARADLRRRIHALNTRHRHRPPVSADLLRRLRQELAPDLDRLEGLLGRDLSLWKDGA